jgi:hypothetical protein
MAPTVDELRNDIRVAVGRYERIESTGFTKESLLAICEALDCDIETDPRPSTAAMRAAIRRAIDRDTDDPGGQFRKADLEAIATALEAT